jgi:hypothetical protein
MRPVTCVPWRTPEWNPATGEGLGWCVEVNRDEAHTKADTLCGMYVALPWANEVRLPTCPDCVEVRKRRGR